MYSLYGDLCEYTQIYIYIFCFVRLLFRCTQVLLCSPMQIAWGCASPLSRVCAWLKDALAWGTLEEKKKREAQAAAKEPLEGQQEKKPQQKQQELQEKQPEQKQQEQQPMATVASRAAA